MKKRETAPIIHVILHARIYTWQHNVPPTVDSRLNTAGETKEEKLGVDEKPNRLHENLPWPTGHPRSSQCEPLKETTTMSCSNILTLTRRHIAKSYTL